MKRILHKSLLPGVICTFLLSFTVQAATISYDLDDKPTEFLGVDIGGTSYDVTVDWVNFFSTVYGYPSVEPLFLGDQTGANNAAGALLAALVADSYTGTVITNYVSVPYAFTTAVSGGGVNLNTIEFTGVNAGWGNNSTTLGYTVWVESVVVPIPGAIWFFSSALGLMGWMRRKAA